jgi:hypothetical protein
MFGTTGGPVYKSTRSSSRKTVAHDPRDAPVAKKGVTTGKAADRTVANIVRQTKAGKGTLTYTPNRKEKK